MFSDEQAKLLHDKATRGIELSVAEQKALDAWHARQDAEEIAALARASPSPSLGELRAEVDEALSRLQTVARQIETQSAKNEQLRRENASLQRELAESRSAPRA